MMSTTPFLQQVARHYASAPALEDYCFVFPNRRSGQFFAHYLQQQLVAADAHRPHLMPSVTAVNDFVAELTGTVSATDIEITFALYDAYCQTMGEAAQEFDRFIYWAQLIISDYNDIDKSLADADSVYSNLSDLHDLSSNYLSPEVQDKVRKIFGETLFTAFFDTSADATLWRRLATDGAAGDGSDDSASSAVKQEFESLWRALSTIYHRYHEVLEGKGLVSPGMQLRRAVEQPRQLTRYHRLVFVGFGVLSAAEVQLFERFKRDDLADYWWDNAGIGRQLRVAPHDPGALLIDGYCRRFPAPVSLEPVDDDMPVVKVVGVPSTVGQAKVAFDEVALMRGGGIETAVILPDENLLVPLLHSVHDVKDLNVTLGYPLRGSGIVSLMHIVARLHNQASKERDVWTYFREDVNDILSHPLIKTYFADEALSTAGRLAVANRFRVPASEFEQLSFADLFRPAMAVSGGESSEREMQTDYLEQLLSFCNLLMSRMQQETSGAGDNDADDDSEVELSLQQAFLTLYIDVLNQLKSALADCEQPLQRTTVFYLIDRLTASAVVPFTGMPLRGLQVMGLLETRSLDFDNIIILSMNERIFPRHRSISSFIPNYIRRALGMSTAEQQEAIVAFNFYRLLNRARHVTLIYDSSTQKMGSSEPSRYIAQLEKIYGVKPEYVEVTVKPSTSNPISIAVPNREGRLRDLYTRPVDPHGDGKYLSASVINKYIACPLMFYLHVVQGLNDDNEASDFMDSGSFGNIIHDTLNDCYRAEDGTERTFTVNDIEFFKKRHLDAAIVRNIKKHYLHVPADKLDADTEPLRGEPLMLIDTIRSYVNFVLDYDEELIRQSEPFTVMECEKMHNIPLLQVGDEKFNFTYKPDRVDRVGGVVRIVDYKTGSDVTCFKPDDDLRELFDWTVDKRRKAILQLFLYCYAYMVEHPAVQQVMPVIYKVPSMGESGVLVGGEKTSDKPQYVFRMDDSTAQAFLSRMATTVKGLFDNDFVQAPIETKPACCNYCRFIDFCRRMPQEKKW